MYSPLAGATHTTAIGDPYTINIDEQKPVIQAADTKTGVYWNAATFAEKGKSTKKYGESTYKI